MNNLCRRISAKNCSGDKIGQPKIKKEWLAFFHNIKNKQYLLSLFVTYLCADDFVLSSQLPILVSNEKETFRISSSVTQVFECSHEEADI